MARRLKKINERQSRVINEMFKRERQPNTDIRIVLVGQKCSGKSIAKNQIILEEIFNVMYERAWLKKYYQDQSYSACVKHEGNFDGVKVSVVETPGWSTDTTLPDTIKEEVLHSVSMCSPGPHVFLLLVPVSRAFTEKDLKALVDVLMPLTERVWRHCIVLFTWGDWLSGLPVENYIVREGNNIQELLEKCGNRYHVLNPSHSDDPVQVKELFQKMFDTVKQNKGYFTTKNEQNTFQKQPWSAKHRAIIEEEWKRRAEELIEQMKKALANEPKESTDAAGNMAHSMDDFLIPFMSKDVPLEDWCGPEIRNQRVHDQVAEWLTNIKRESKMSSGLGSICSSIPNVETIDENSPLDKNHPQIGEFSQTE